jgi:predicted Zn-dependent protease
MKSRQLLIWLLLSAVAAPAHIHASAPASGQALRLWRLAAQEQARLDQRGVILNDPCLSRYLQDVAERLWVQTSSPLPVPTVEIIADTRIDAYAYPNGVCFLSTGMLDLLETESQLAMILAHEMIHYARQHAAALYNHFQRTHLQGGRSGDDDCASAGGLAMRQSIAEAERQADAEGVAILRAAGYCDREVLPLMANLVNCMLDRGHTKSAAQLTKRTIRFSALIHPDEKRPQANAATDADRNGYRDRVAPALLTNAQLAVQRGDWAQAEKSISRFLAAEPLDARGHYLKGEILRRRNGKGPDAACIAAYQKALEVDPTFPPTHRALGEIHYKAGRYRMARPHFETFLHLAPNDMASTFIKGYLQQCRK